MDERTDKGGGALSFLFSFFFLLFFFFLSLLASLVCAVLGGEGCLSQAEGRGQDEDEAQLLPSFLSTPTPSDQSLSRMMPTVWYLWRGGRERRSGTYCPVSIVGKVEGGTNNYSLRCPFH